MLDTNAGYDIGIHGLQSVVDNEKDSDVENLRDRMWKIVADWDSRSSRMLEEGGEGTKSVAH